VVASSAVPGLFEPVRRGDRLLVDGGLVVNVPVRVARDLGADYVLGVDIMALDEEAVEPKHAWEVMLLSWEIVQHQSGQGGVPPDLMVTPAVGALNPWDFSKVDDAYAAGVAAMEAALPQLQADLARGVPVAPAADA
jgi:NTE family protein